MMTPKLADLIKFAKQCGELYTTRRSEFDEQRFFSVLRATTHNPERLNGAAFIEKIGKVIEEQKFGYHGRDAQFYGKDYNAYIAPFLKNVISGALFLELNRVDNTYNFKSRVKNYSALGNLILQLFKIDSKSDIPPEHLKQSLTDLSQFLKVMNTSASKDGSSWRNDMSDDDLQSLLSAEIEKLDCHDASLVM